MLLSAQPVTNKGLNAITEDAVEAQLEFLSSDWTEGRGTGTRGAYLAADYIASMFKVYGLEPGGDMESQRWSRKEINQGKQNKTYRSYYQNFQLIEYSAADEQYLSFIEKSKDAESEINFDYKTDFNVSPAAISQSGTAPIVFVGYGLKDEDNDYDDFDKVDVKGKIILRINGFPGHKDPDSEAAKKFTPENRWQRWQMMRSKGEAAAEAGALAVLEIDMEGNSLKGWAENIPFRFNTSMFEGDERPPIFYDTRMTLPGDTIENNTPFFVISLRMANKILEGTGINIEEFESNSAKEGKPSSQELKNKMIRFKTKVNSKIINARNVIGVLKGKDTTSMIVVGAHYDHLGKYHGFIWNGADDNASGTVGVMTVAKACLATGERPEKTIVFAAWTGEEKGLWGSKYFADHPYDDLDIVMNLNYDMISRDNEDDENKNQCSMTYTKKFGGIEEITKKNIEEYDIDLDISYRASESARGGSDHAPFAQKDIPYFYFMAGFPPEYHQPDDHIELVNIPKMTNIIRIGFLNVWNFANSEDWKQ
jgi:hypothetical protein